MIIYLVEEFYLSFSIYPNPSKKKINLINGQHSIINHKIEVEKCRNTWVPSSTLSPVRRILADTKKEKKN